MKRSRLAIALACAAVLGGGGLALTLRAGPPARAALPPIGTVQLISSVRRAGPVPMAGTVHLDERLGLAGLGAQPDPGSGARTARLWCDGHGRRRISLPAGGSEHTIVNDGRRVWSWDSATRTVTSVPVGAGAPAGARKLARFQAGELMGNPVDAAGALLNLLAPASVIRLDPAETVAGRAAYELVLEPLPTERTMLREVRVAVDGQTHLPLEVTVLANGSSDPALRIGFTDLRFGPQDPALFRFTPPRGAAIDVRQARATPPTTASHRPRSELVGTGWDTVLLRRTAPGPADQKLLRVSTPISGRWGHGRLVSTAIGNAVITTDGRVAMGAVPAQVLTEALDR